jgi:hypothetical protein
MTKTHGTDVTAKSRWALNLSRADREVEDEEESKTEPNSQYAYTYTHTYTHIHTYARTRTLGQTRVNTWTPAHFLHMDDGDQVRCTTSAERSSGIDIIVSIRTDVADSVAPVRRRTYVRSSAARAVPRAPQL